MKNLTKTVIFILSAVFVSCSCGDKPNEETAETKVTPDYYSDTHPVMSQKAYNRGFEMGSEIALMNTGSKEKEHAMLEVHSIISALERNGFPQSAADFSKGVQAGLKN